MVISPTARWIRWSIQVYACELMWTCLVWAERSTPDTFWVTIYTVSEPPSQLSNSLMPSAKPRIANLQFLRLWYDAVGDRTPPSRTPSGRSSHYATRGRSRETDGPLGKCVMYADLR